MGGQECPSKDRLDGKTVVITDGTDEVSETFVKECCARGAANIVLGCANQKKSKSKAAELTKSFPDVKIIEKSLNLCSDESIKKFSNELLTEVQKIDILVINTRKSSNVKQVFRGPFALVFSLLSLLRNSNNGRVISVVDEQYSSVDVKDLKSLTENDSIQKFHAALLSATKWIARKCKGKIDFH